jgi:putative tryptophan/tyrosine transport system substrate-binding protein
MSHIRRRDFITLLGGSAAWPLMTRAQQPERMRSVGVLTPFAPHDSEGQNRVAAFVQALQQLGWSVGQNIRLHYRWGDGTSATMQKYAVEIVALTPDVILADSSAAVAPLLHDPNDSDRFRDCRRSGRRRLCGKLGAAGWQRHRLYPL